jgi:CheY-like chemotaxis protein
MLGGTELTTNLMDTPIEPSSNNSSDSVSKATSELNNLLQIISGTSALMETAGQNSEDTEKYLAMLRASIERAEKVAAELSEQTGGTTQRTAINPDLAAFTKSRKTLESSTSKQSILLVDDEQMALTLMKRILTEAGYNVVTAQSGFECLDLFRRRPYSFELILLDLTMPFMDGEETFERLKEIRSDVPVLLATGFIQEDRLKRLMAVGLAGFVRKPIAPGEIVGVVRSTLQTVKYAGGQTPTGGISVVL